MIGGVLGMGRRIAESRMTDSCEVTRPGERVWDEPSGEWVTAQVVAYSGKCRIRQPSTAAKPVDAASQLLVVSSLELHLPIGVLALPGDIATIADSDTRPDQSGRRFKILAPFDGSQTTAARYRVEAFDER